MEPEGPDDGSVVVLGYDGVAADEAGVLVSVLVEAGLPVTVASVGGAGVTSYHGRIQPTTSAAGLGPCLALVVPGGMGIRRAADDAALVEVIARLAGGARWLAASSTGSVLLAAAGVVDGARAATHWLARDLLLEHGVQPVDQGFVEHGRLLTASGPASAVEVAFRLVGALLGATREEELRASYRPPPPADHRYRPQVPFWRAWGRKRIEPTRLDLDPTGQATVVLLDLELDEWE